MFCSKCGFELPDDAIFCSKCGEKHGASQNISDSVISNSTVIGTNIEMKSNILGNIENHYSRMIDCLGMGDMIGAKSAYADAKLIDVNEAKSYFQDNGKAIAIGYYNIAFAITEKLKNVNYYEEYDSYNGIWEGPPAFDIEFDSILDEFSMATENALSFYPGLNEGLFEAIKAYVSFDLNDPLWNYWAQIGSIGGNAVQEHFSSGGPNAALVKQHRDVCLGVGRDKIKSILGSFINFKNNTQDYDKSWVSGTINNWVNAYNSIYPSCPNCATCVSCGGSGKKGLFSSKCSNCNGTGIAYSVNCKHLWSGIGL
tara:strand:+ start:1451 stop:2386 length:936 start_codon:yes stop_codon:yes gene_type:complete